MTGLQKLILTRILIIAIVLNTSFATSKAQTTPLTLEWIFSDEGRRPTSPPSHLWLADGMVILYDNRLPVAQRQFEILDPKTGERRKALNMEAALASLSSLLPAAPKRQVLAWPQSFDPFGRQALYIFNGDLFVLELSKARFSRLTNTSEQ